MDDPKHDPNDGPVSAAALAALCPRLRHVIEVGGTPGPNDFETLLAAEGAAPPLPDRPGAETPVALFHTGGSTGLPRLARHTQGNQLHAALGTAALIGTREEDVVLNGFPVFHVAGPLVYGLSTWLAGGNVLLPTRQGLRNRAFVERCWRFVEREHVSLLVGVPTLLTMLLQIDPGAARLEGVRGLFTGGAPLPDALAARFESRFGIPVRNVFGMTECAGGISVEPLAAPRTAGSSGLALPFTEIRAGAGSVLEVRGPGVSAGYAGLGPSAEAAAPGSWLNTGDIGHLDEQGRVFVTGRAKDLIIRGGHNIDPRPIEEALLAHPAVQLAAAVGAPDEYAGELPVAYVLLKPGAAVGIEELSAFARPRIPERAAWPKRIELLAEMPLTAIGKVYKPALRRRAIEQVVGDRLASAGLAGAVTAAAVDEGLRLCVVFRHRGGGEATQCASLTDRLQAMMAGFAFGHRWAEELPGAGPA